MLGNRASSGAAMRWRKSRARGAFTTVHAKSRTEKFPSTKCSGSVATRHLIDDLRCRGQTNACMQEQCTRGCPSSREPRDEGRESNGPDNSFPTLGKHVTVGRHGRATEEESRTPAKLFETSPECLSDFNSNSSRELISRVIHCNRIEPAQLLIRL